MSFWIYMLIMTLLAPAIMLFFGVCFMKRAPKRINVAFGYRSAMSMKNMDTWRFAHSYCGRLWRAWGAIMLPLSVLPMLFVIGAGADIAGYVGGAVCAVQIIPLAGAVIATELALRRRFDSEGKQR